MDNTPAGWIIGLLSYFTGVSSDPNVMGLLMLGLVSVMTVYWIAIGMRAFARALRIRMNKP